MQSKAGSLHPRNATSSASRTMRWRAAATVCATLYMLAFASYIAQRPSYSWDMLAYMAIALHDGGTPVARIHEQAYAALDAALPPDQLDALTGRGTVDPKFRQAVAADSDSFPGAAPVL